jgi:DNA processing protein
MLSLDEAASLSVWPGGWKLPFADAVAQMPPDAPFEAVVEMLAGKPLSTHAWRRLRRAAAASLEAARNAGIDPVPWGEPRYPPLLASVADAPPMLWVRGAVDTLTRPAVALVGSRAASPYGLETAHHLAADLAAAGLVVVSGLARGVDSAAHRGALVSGGDTVAVLGSGADVIYPPEHEDLAAAIAGHGAVVSELPPGEPPRAFHFPARNRIISGLSLAVVVVEATEKSGSLITARCALDQGRAVLAVPGNILSGRHRGSHALIKDGAAVVESAEDILAEVRSSWTARMSANATGEAGPEEHPIVSHMTAGESYDLDVLGRETGLCAADLLPRLLELELQGAVRRLDGGRFMRAG